MKQDNTSPSPAEKILISLVTQTQKGMTDYEVPQDIKLDMVKLDKAADQLYSDLLGKFEAWKYSDDLLKEMYSKKAGEALAYNRGIDKTIAILQAYFGREK